MIELERQCRVSSTDSRAAADNEKADTHRRASHATSSPSREARLGVQLLKLNAFVDEVSESLGSRNPGMCTCSTASIYLHIIYFVWMATTSKVKASASSLFAYYATWLQQ